MERYIISKEAAKHFNKKTVLATEKLAEAIEITDEGLHFNNFDNCSVLLTFAEVEELKIKGFKVEKEIAQKVTVLAAPDYEKTRSLWYRKANKKLLTGKGIKVACLDSGATESVIGYQYSANFADANPTVADIYGHGTLTASIVKSTIGIAQDCEMHILKIITDSGNLFESSFLAALDYVIDNNLDAINLSFQYFSFTSRDAIAEVINNGTVVFAASGNSNTENFTVFPAAYPDVVAVNTASPNKNELSYKNVLTPTTFEDPTIYHGITVSCSGIFAEYLNKEGVYAADYGTSLASPFAMGAFALYKEELQEEDNYKVLNYMLKRAKRQTNNLYYGAGIIEF